MQCHAQGVPCHQPLHAVAPPASTRSPDPPFPSCTRLTPRTCSGEHWRASRAAWQPFFSRQSLQGHATFMVRSADALCALLGSAAGTAQQVDVWRSLQSLTLDVVGRTAFGVDFNTLAAADSQEGAEADAAAEPAPAAEPAAAGKGGLRARSLCSASTDALLRAVRTVFEVCGPAQPLFGLCFIFPEVSSCGCAGLLGCRSSTTQVGRPASRSGGLAPANFQQAWHLRWRLMICPAAEGARSSS